jgi:hypothetical protein
MNSLAVIAVEADCKTEAAAAEFKKYTPSLDYGDITFSWLRALIPGKRSWKEWTLSVLRCIAEINFIMSY